MNAGRNFKNSGRGKRRNGRGGGGGRGAAAAAAAGGGRERESKSIRLYEPVSEGNAALIHIRVELVKQIDPSSQEEEGHLHTLLSFAFQEAARRSGVEVHECGELTVTPLSGSNHSRMLLTCEVKSGDWQRNLAILARVFHEYLDAGVRRFGMPLLVAHSPLLFPLRLICSHNRISIGRISFGSLLTESQLGVHWTIVGGQKTESDRRDGFTFFKDIDGAFEYDTGVIRLFFYNRDENSKHPKLSQYKISIQMQSITRICLDQRKSENDHNRCSLVLSVEYPPRIEERKKKKQRFDDEAAGWGDWEHRRTIQRGRYPGEVANAVALHECGVIVIEFDAEEVQKRWAPGGSTLDQLAYDIVSRLRQITRKAVVFSSYEQLDRLEGEVRGGEEWMDERTGRRRRWQMIEVVPYDIVEPDGMDERALEMIERAAWELANRRKSQHFSRDVELLTFKLRAFLEGILQRGMRVRSELLYDPKVWHDFVEKVTRDYVMDEQRTLDVLERLLGVLAEERPYAAVDAAYNELWSTSRNGERTKALNEEEKRKGYTRIMRLVVTPTRQIFLGFETIMGNRVLKKHSYNGTEIIRISFRDESGGFMRPSSTGEEVIWHRLLQVLSNRDDRDGLKFGGRRFVWLGNSNSQLKDKGTYMYHETDTTASSIRRSLGRFHLMPNIAKWLARMGQCFTQARASESAIPHSEVGISYDFIGGGGEGKPFVFSDGCGSISLELAKSLSDEHALGRTATAFQIRHQGQKGLLAVDPLIDDRNRLLSMMGRTGERKQVFIRPSMSKFEVDELDGRKSTTNLEIVKWSSPSPVFLNKPMLNILSQVSERQSAAAHARLAARVLQLLHDQLQAAVQSLFIEAKAREAIRELAFPFAMEVFSDACPLEITSEPFLRSMLTASMRYMLDRQLSKMHIKIPESSGRSMFGAVDTTGILQYGQVFVQYSTSTSKHYRRRRERLDDRSEKEREERRRNQPAENAQILTGPLMITKNPCISMGDVRRFEAVDVPGLRHLVDVVVFPRHGPRPHPDEMAGSDLDGDEYALIWDEAFLFERNEEASVFTVGEEEENWPIMRHPNGEVDFQRCEKQLINFYITAAIQEQVGILSTAHLSVSDYYGLESIPARSLAGKISQSLDFPKNGVEPEPMTMESEEDPNDPTRFIPAEKSMRKPDYMEKLRDPAYQSTGIMGEVYKEICRYQHSLDTNEERVEQIVLDPDFNLPEWRKYEEGMRKEYEEYAHQIRAIMERFGIESEGELLSGEISSIKNRISEKEEYDKTMYNTSKMIDEKVKREISEARKRFFAPLLNWQRDLTPLQDQRKDVDLDNIFSCIVRPSTPAIESIRLKAAAAYNVCYEAANKQLQSGDKASIILSFPWIVYDVLADIKSDRARGEKQDVEEEEIGNDPLAKVISRFVDTANEEEVDAFEKEFASDGTIMSRSIKESRDLARACFVLLKWAESIGGFERRSTFRREHLLALFIHFGLGQMQMRGTRRRYIQMPSGETRRHLRKGEHLLRFIEYVSSREFRSLSHLSFGEVYPGLLSRGEWRELSERAIPSFLTIITSHSMEMLAMGGGGEGEAETLRKERRMLSEAPTRKMELPETAMDDLPTVRKWLLRVSGCKDVQLRRKGPGSVLVSASGEAASFRRLLSYVVPPPPARAQATLLSGVSDLPVLIYQKLRRDACSATNRSKLFH